MTTSQNIVLYFRILTHSGGTWVFSEICIDPSHIKTFSTLFSKYYRIPLRGSFTIYSRLCVFLLQIKSAALHFWSPWCSPSWYRNLHKSSSGNTFLSRYFSDLSSSIISGFIASFYFISINQLFCAVHLVYNATKFNNSNCQYFFQALVPLSIHVLCQLYNCFVNSLLNASTNVVWVCLLSIAPLQKWTLFFPSEFVTSVLN